MKPIICKLNLDCSKNGNQGVVNVKKNDTFSRELIISLVNNGRPYEIEDGCYATFRGVKPDGTVIFNACEISENRILYTVTTQTISAAGEVNCEITLYESGGSQLASPCFTIMVEDILYDDSEIESTNEYTALSVDLARSEAVENISFQNSGTHIQWKHESDTQWNDLAALSEITGPQGIQGIQGVQGDKASWIFGTQVTDTGIFSVTGSKAGDVYLNTSTMNVYFQTALTVWVYACNIKGATGATGAQGVNAQWLTGTAVTGTGTYTVDGARAGDVYLNTDTYNLYKAETASSWTYLCNIKGEKGDTGDTGPSVTVDTAVSAMSFNAVGNNAVYNALYSLESRMTEKTSYGVISGLVVSAQTTPNMTVQVSSGVVYMPPISTGMASARFAPAGTTLTVTASDATNPRFDIVYINSSGTVSYLAGTAAASPVQPSTPSNGLLLAVITVLAESTTITSGSIDIVKKSLWTEAWTAPTLVNGWTRLDGYPVRFKKNITNTVNLRGRVATGTAGTYIFLLPAGYRPIVITQLICAHGATGAIRIEIHPSGYVYCINSYTSYLDLSGISFYAE